MSDTTPTGSEEGTGDVTEAATAAEATPDPSPETVQQYRHKARKFLKDAQRSLSVTANLPSFRTDATREVYVLVNGMIETTIQGRVGLSQDEQVERLTTAHDTLVENMAALPDKVAAAKESLSAVLAQYDEARANIEAQIASWDEAISAEAQKAVDTLAEAAQFARERDFDAWQANKRRGKSGAYSAPVESDDADPEDSDPEED